MATASSGSCLTLSSRSISFTPAKTVARRGAAIKTTVEIGKGETVKMPPCAPEVQWLCDSADVPLPCWRAPRGVGVGLGNPHALCFMNAVIQALAYTPGFADDCLEGRHRLSCFSRLRGASHKGGPQGAPRGESNASVSFCAFCKLEQQVLAIYGKPGGPSQGRAPCRGPPRWVPNQLAAYIRPFVWRAFKPGRQEDAHEFFRFLLDALMKAPATAAAADLQQQQQTVRKEVKPEVALTSYFGRLFGSWLRSSVVCTECGSASVRFESALDIPLDIGGPLGAHEGVPLRAYGGVPRFSGGLHGAPPQKPYTLEKAFTRFIAKETLSGNNAYMCQHCNKKVTATKQLQLFTTPRVLVFALKRFSMSISHGFPVPMKCHRPVIFPANLNLLPYVAPDAVKVHQLQQRLLQQQQLKLAGITEKSLGSAASTTASSPSSSPPHSPSPSSPSVPFPATTAAGPCPSAAGGASNGAAAAPSYLYRLFAVVSHSGGSLSSGHYRAFVRAPAVASQLAGQLATGGEPASWLAIDDEMVSVVSEAAVLCRLQQEAYLLFYSKIPSKAEMQQQQQQQQHKQQQQQQQQKEVELAAYSDEEEEDGIGASSVSSLEPYLSTSEDEWSSCSGSSNSSSSGSRDGDGRLNAAHPFLHELRKTHRRRELTPSNRRRVLLAFRCHFLLKRLHQTRREALGLPLQQQQQRKEVQQEQQQRRQVQQEQQHPKVISLMTAEMMRKRKRAAASRQQQFGCNTASPWEEEGQQAAAAAAAEEQQLFERLQTLQQPLPNKRSRHDREYDMGRTKKVKNPLSNKPVGLATVVTTQADSETGAFLVQQRAAFDCLQQKGSHHLHGRFSASQKKGELAQIRRGHLHRKGAKGKGWKGKKSR